MLYFILRKVSQSGIITAESPRYNKTTEAARPGNMEERTMEETYFIKSRSLTLPLAKDVHGTIYLTKERITCTVTGEFADRSMIWTRTDDEEGDDQYLKLKFLGHFYFLHV